MSKPYNQTERDWLLKKVTSATAQTPLNLLRRKYYSSYTGVLAVGEEASKLSIGELEWRWLIKYITANGGTITDDEKYADMWIKMVLTISLVPTKYVNQNKLIFYGNAA
jgi:hypothetical protein